MDRTGKQKNFRDFPKTKWCRHVLRDEVTIFTSSNIFGFRQMVRFKLSNIPHCLHPHPWSLLPHLHSFATFSISFTYSSTSLASSTVKSRLFPSKTTYGTLSTPFPACSLISIFVSCNPSYSSSIKSLASFSEIPAARAALRRVEVDEGWARWVKYWV